MTARYGESRQNAPAPEIVADPGPKSATVGVPTTRPRCATPVSGAISSGAYLDATQSVLREHGGLWFWDESYVISRKRDSG